jgi:hypothetical protein
MWVGLDMNLYANGSSQYKSVNVGADCNISPTLLMKEKKSQGNYIWEVSHIA